MAANVESLKGVEMFQGVPDSTLERLERMARERNYEPGDEIMSQDMQGVGVFVLLDGEAEFVRDGQTLGTLGPGSFFGEMALLDHYRRSGTIRAKQPSRCLAIPRSDFVAELKASNDLCFNMLVHMTHRVRDLDERLAAAGS
ncbi:MAG: cyclic nucleotide-binding domain-containing protein [Dehalococcoidia bacterium]|nr:cyclic nucleotide-binding domain-containing protein [Dehalococcoidia bacterium]MCA9844074.1 cyclic nucleotide-binding domain-containing protein [Dehalococcoidia bacterium]MCA9854192.1 cyclic nucleotide-binding domain-containing protein [Dehalococcoidia bacterium]